MEFPYQARRSFPRAVGLAILALVLVLPPGVASAKKFLSAIREGTAFRDRNKNGQLDVADKREKRAITGPDGSFKLADGKGRVYLQGGFEIETGLPNTQLLTTPPAGKAIGTLTALWQALLDRRQPGGKIKKMLNVKGNVAVVNFVAKPIDQVKPKVQALVKRNAQQRTLVQFLKALGAGKKAFRMAAAAEAGSCPDRKPNAPQAEDQAISALACALIGLEPDKKKQWAALDLTVAGTVKELFAGALGELGVTPPEDADLTILANAAAALNQRIETGTTPEELAELARAAAAEARLVADGRYADLNNVASGRTPLLTAVTPDTGPDVTDAVTSNPRPTLSGLVGSGAVKVRIYLGETVFGEVDVGPAGLWSYTPGGEGGLEDGTYGLSFISLDGSDAESPPSPITELVIDTVAPEAAAVDRLMTSDTTPTLTGTWQPEDSLAVTVNGVTYSGSELGFDAEIGWSLSIPEANALPVGTYDVTTRVTDRAGNFTDQLAAGVLTVQAGLFGSATTAAAGSNPIAVVRGDFNFDGQLDLAVANQAGNSVSLLRGNGNGSFQAALTTAVGNAPYALAAADLNSDGRLDLAVANSGDNTVSVLLGSDGGFQAPLNLAAGNSPYGVALLDANGDGYPDIATANVNGNTVSVLVSDGSGGYLPAQTLTGLAGPYAIAAADVTGDGRDDLVVGNSTEATVSVIPSNGESGFLDPVSHETGGGVTGVALGDLNADGLVDIVSANNAGNSVSVLLNTASGGFAAPVDYPAGVQARNVAIGDLDGDGKPDLAVTSVGGNTVGLLRGNGDGSFQTPPVAFATGQTPWGLALGDLNGDDKLDLAVANWGAGTVSVLLNQRSNQLFQPKTDYPVASLPYAIGAADLDADGDADLATANLGGTVSVLLNQGTGTFAGPADYQIPPNSIPFGSIVLGLLDGDTVPDIMVTATTEVDSSSQSSLSLLLGTGNGGFAPQQPYSLDSRPSAIAAGLLDGDQAADLVVLDGNGVNVYASNGQVAVPTTPSYNYPIGGSLQGVVLDRFDAGNTLDIAVADVDSGQVRLLYGNGDGSFTVPDIGFPTGPNPIAVAAGDLNQDGVTDLAVANFGATTVSVLLGGSGGFQPKVDFPVGFFPRAVALADLNGDGNLDLVVASEFAATVSVLIGNGQGGFWAPVPYSVGGFVWSLAVADFNGDGKPDLASGNLGGSVSVRLNASP